MTSIRIAVISALAVATVIAGGSSTARHSAPAQVSHTVALGQNRAAQGGPVECCD